MQENTSNPSTGELANVPLTGADKVAYAFYATAAAAALVGQVWAGVTHIPWPDEGFSTFLKILVVTPAVAVLELGGVATAALADLRRRKGEQAYAYRAMSFFAALVAVVFNVVGHWRPEERFLAFGFGGLSAFAYVLWLIHSSARRRDALRRAGQMRETGPVYGVVQWAREPRVTWLARSLAIEHGYSLYESLRAAHHQIRNKSRRDAIAGTVAEYIRSEHQDERLAKIAETTYDPDRLAGMLEERINYEVITSKLTKAISPPPEPEERPAVPAAVWVLEGGQPRRAEGTGVSLRDEDAWTGELMAVDYQVPNDESVAEAVVVEDESEPEHVVQNGASDGPSNGAVNGSVNGKLKPLAPQPKAEPVVQKPQPPSPFADATDTQPPALITTAPAEPVARKSVVDEAVVAKPAMESMKIDEPAAEPTALEKKRMRAWALLSDWPEGHERTAKKLADAIASSEPMAARFIEQYEAEHGLVFTSQN
ncbi:hypothetical protein E0H75_08690 [Kribbella capetownensis]|uniref:DUF2637 domain-containing protein n=1 Tax=Kribbella capetownensis TaxID=1572659 RepID=A0A4R0K1C3_9ACTN|nr:hypothetical protein [Kribbella capetownensis]TCC53741.1 hypothetical protein E0H75_08690 [Kribbella capetownensis]